MLGQDAQDYILGHFQSSLRDWIVFVDPTQDFILGYYQPSLAGLFRYVTIQTLIWKSMTVSRPCGTVLPCKSRGRGGQERAEASQASRVCVRNNSVP